MPPKRPNWFIVTSTRAVFVGQPVCIGSAWGPCGVVLPGEHWRLCSQPSRRPEGPSYLLACWPPACSPWPLSNCNGSRSDRADGILNLEDISQPWGPSRCPCERHLHRPTLACGVHWPTPKNLEAPKQTWKTSKYCGRSFITMTNLGYKIHSQLPWWFLRVNPGSQ